MEDYRLNESLSVKIGIACYHTYGGSGTIAAEIGMQMAFRGHEVHFLSEAPPARLTDFSDNLFFHEVVAPNYPLFVQRPFSVALASKMVDVSLRVGLDILHVHYAVPLATSAFLAGQVLGKNAPKIVTTLHGTDITLVGSDPSFLPITRFSIEKSDWITAPSTFLRGTTYEELGVSPQAEIEVIPNFVNSEVFSLPKSAVTGDLCDNYIDDKRVITHISNFRPVKRLDDVIEIFSLVREKMPAHLLLIGDGPDRSRIESEVRRRGLEGDVCFLGKQLNFVEKLQMSDVFLLPSESESFGLAALEAMSCGVPVVASDVGGLPEVVGQGREGFLAPVGDTKAMSEYVLQLLEDSSLRSSCGRAARAAAVGKFSQDKVIDSYESRYKNLLGEV